MGLVTTKQLSSTWAVAVTVIAFLATNTTAADSTSLVFKGCTKQQLKDPTGTYSNNLKNLYDALISESSQKSFYSTTSLGSGDTQSAIDGLYQCRGDLTNSQCYNCVSEIPKLVDRLCGKAVAFRIQLNGCYLKYQTSGFNEPQPMEFLYKVCRSKQGNGTLFGELRDYALDALVNGLKNSSNGFYTGTYRSLYYLGQCEGDLSNGDCLECVRTALEEVKGQCGDTINGQVYLNKCYISYNYYPNGVPAATLSPDEVKKKDSNMIPGIAIGGAMIFVLSVCVLLCGWSHWKKSRPEDEDMV